MIEREKKWRWIIPVFVLIIAGITFLVYTEQYYHADKTTYYSLESDETVKVMQTEYGWLFDGPSETDAIISSEEQQHKTVELILQIK